MHTFGIDTATRPPRTPTRLTETTAAAAPAKGEAKGIRLKSKSKSKDWLMLSAARRTQPAVFSFNPFSRPRLIPFDFSDALLAPFGYRFAGPVFPGSALSCAYLLISWRYSWQTQESAVCQNTCRQSILIRPELETNLLKPRHKSKCSQGQWHSAASCDPCPAPSCICPSTIVVTMRTLKCGLRNQSRLITHSHSKSSDKLFPFPSSPVCACVCVSLINVRPFIKLAV